MIQNTKAQKSLILIGLAAAAVNAQAQENTTQPEQLDELPQSTVIATKFDKKLSDISQRVNQLNLAELEREGVFTLRDAIGFRQAGVLSTATAGQTGQGGSLFIRGSATNQSQMRLDGVRISSSSLGLAGFLGSANLGGLSNVEILKGPSSSIYGGEAIGGVVALTTARGKGDPTQKFYAEGGSFGSWRNSFTAQGEVGDFAYNLNVNGFTTQNDGEGRDFRQGSASVRLDYSIDDSQSVGLTYRGSDDYYETPENGPQQTRRDLELITLFYENTVSDLWQTKFTMGYYNEALDTTPSGNSFDAEQFSVYWDNQFFWNEVHQSGFGVSFESVNSDNRFPAFPTSNRADSRGAFGIYAQHNYVATDTLTLNAGVRYEAQDSFKNAWSWNVGAIWEVAPTWSIIANVGEAYRTPNAFEATSTVPLGPEFGESWEVGVEKQLKKGNLKLTWFETDITDEIRFVNFAPSVYNNFSSSKSKRNGLEASYESSFDYLDSKVWASYTYLQRSNSGNAFPQQVVAVGASCKPYAKTEVGVTTSWVDQASYSSFGQTNGDYFLVNLHANYQLTDSILLHARVENLFDDNYNLFSSPGFGGGAPTNYPGRGRGAFAGFTYTF